MSTPVLLIHGFTSGPFAFEFLIPRLRLAGYSPAVPTLSGHGRGSWRMLEGFSWRDWLSDAREALNALPGGTVVIGHSMGGLLALNLAAENPGKLAGLVLAGAALHLASPFGPGRPLGFFQPVMKGLFKSWDMTPFYTHRSMLRTDRNYRRAPMASISTFMELVGETGKKLTAVTTPALILQGKRDRRVHWRSAEMISRSISTPDGLKRTIMFADTDHEMFRDCEREQVIVSVLDYLAEVENRSV